MNVGNDCQWAVGVWCVCWLFIFVRTPSRVPYGTPSACANRAAYPDPPRSPPPRIHRRPGGLPWTAQHYCPVVSGPNCFQALGSSPGLPQSVCVGCLFLRTPSRAPYRTPPACANRAAYPDPPPVVPTQNPSTPRRPTVDGTALLPGCLRPKLFPGIGVLPGPATESHVVNRGTPVAPLDSRS